MESLLVELVALGVDVAIFTVFYKLYRHRAENTRALKEAPILDINGQLPSKIEKSGNVIPYAVISGAVKATVTPLKSHFLPHIKGVIREKVTKERKIRWSPMLRLWSTVEDDIQRSLNTVPFVLSNRGWLLMSPAVVEVVDPLTAEKFSVPTIYDEFTSHHDTLGQAVVGWFRGERTTGIQEIEKMLCEGSVLTGVGELVLENDRIKLQPPSTPGLSYFLTSLSIDSLIKKLDEDVRTFKILTVIFGCVGACLFTYIVTVIYQAKKRKWDLLKRQKQIDDARKQRRLLNPSSSEENGNHPVCVICLTNSVEVVILECGHACLCLFCSERINGKCPVCRSRVDRIVTAFLP